MAWWEDMRLGPVVIPSEARSLGGLVGIDVLAV
jgi:hypothetical protein